MISGWPSYKPRGNRNLMKATLVLHILNVLFSLLMLINDLITHVTLSNSYKFVVLSLLFSLRCISPNSHDHYIRQTSRRFAPSAISRACHVQTCDHYSIDIYMVNKFYHCFDIHFPSKKQWNCSCSYFTGYLQSRQISPESDIRWKSALKCTNKGGTQTKEVRL